MQVKVTVTVELTTELEEVYKHGKLVNQPSTDTYMLAKEAMAHGAIMSIHIEKIK